MHYELALGQWNQFSALSIGLNFTKTLEGRPGCFALALILLFVVTDKGDVYLEAGYGILSPIFIFFVQMT